MARKLGINWDKQPLGEVSDVELARRLGCHASVVHRQRVKRGIPTQFSSGKGINWDEQPLGEVSDYELARRLGCSESSVREQRNNRGTPAYKQVNTCRSCGVQYGSSAWQKTTLCPLCSRRASSVRQRYRKEGLEIGHELDDFFAKLSLATVKLNQVRKSQKQGDVK